jgi:hypothetical protein
MRSFRRSLIAIPFLTCSAAFYPLQGAILTVPPGMNPGETYRLVFVTSTVRDATFTNVEDYNDFVTDTASSVPALASLGATWRAIASTASASAVANVGDSLAQFTVWTGRWWSRGQICVEGVIPATRADATWPPARSETGGEPYDTAICWFVKPRNARTRLLRC